MEIKKQTAIETEGVSRPERKSLLRAAPDNVKTPEAEDDSRKQRGQEAGDERQVGKNTRSKRNLGLRILFWLLRKSIVPALCIIAILGGMYIGYSMLGKRAGEDIFVWDTWKHMYDLIFADS